MRISKPITISLPPKLFRRVEKVAKEENRTRSELLREALRQYLENREWKRLFQYGAGRAKAMGIQEEDVEKLVDEVRY